MRSLKLTHNTRGGYGGYTDIYIHLRENPSPEQAAARLIPLGDTIKSWGAPMGPALASHVTVTSPMRAPFSNFLLLFFKN